MKRCCCCRLTDTKTPVLTVPGVNSFNLNSHFWFLLRDPHDYPAILAEAGGRGGLRPGVGWRGCGEARRHPPWKSLTAWGYYDIISMQTIV